MRSWSRSRFLDVQSSSSVVSCVVLERQKLSLSGRGYVCVLDSPRFLSQHFQIDRRAREIYRGSNAELLLLSLLSLARLLRAELARSQCTAADLLTPRGPKAGSPRTPKRARNPTTIRLIINTLSNDLRITLVLPRISPFPKWGPKG